MIPSGIDASTSYISTGPYSALKANIPYQTFSPRELNINFYADMLFTSKDFATDHPETVIAMRNALTKGWQYARTHQDEINLSNIAKISYKSGFRPHSFNL